MTLSLNSRLLLAASAASAVFLGVTGLVLDRAFRSSAETAVRNHLQGQLYALLAAFDVDADGRLIVPSELPEPRLARPESGLYGRIVDDRDVEVWRSESLVGRGLPRRSRLSPGVSVFERIAAGDGEELFWLRFGVSWELSGRTPSEYEFTVAEDPADFTAEVGSFRRSLWLWLGGAVLVLLAVQGAVLRWGLTPLRYVAEEISAVERGEQATLERDYPTELSGLTRNINAFIANERRQIERYRNTLGDLAHSLKTPLAVIRGLVETRQSANDDEIAAQVDRMADIVDYQLRRAAAAGRRTLAAPVDVGASVDKIVNSLRKVYAERELKVSVEVPPHLKFYGDEGDLLEVMGNLLDNAFKWAHERIAVHAESDAVGARRPGVRLTVVDDGPGIPQDLRENAVERGVSSRDDTRGQGLGLAFVKDIIEAYGGSLDLEVPGGGGRGTRVRVEFPTA